MEKKSRILVIDDEKIICTSCKQALEKEGLSVDCAENGFIGLAKLQDEDYDLVLIDLMMPQMSGMDVLKALNKLNSDIVAILITGFATIESAVAAMKRGAYDYISKPFTPDELRRVVHKGMERRKLLVEASKLREERVQNLEKLAAEQSRLETIINCMGEGLVATNLEAELILINETACGLLDIQHPPAVGRHIRGYLNNFELEQWILDTLKTGEFPRGFINREILYSEEKAKVYSITLAPIRSKGENVSGLALVLMDVSNEKKLEKRKIEFQKLVSIVAHELKAPINAIEGYLDVIIKGYVEKDRKKELEYIERCHNKTEMLRILVQDLLSLTSIDSGKLTKQMIPINVLPLLNDIITFAENEAQQKSIRVIREIPDQSPLVIGDKNALGYLFSNLMNNAIKYNKTNGEITVRVEANEEYLIVSFIDKGIGISEEEIGKIFNEFFRSKNKAIANISGSGLGLPIAKRIAELHNGSIRVKSQLDKGSQFDVHIPILKMI